MRRLSKFVLALGALAMFAGECSAEVSVGGGSGFDVDRLEEAIDEELFGNAPEDATHDPVVCPDEPDEEPGSVFVCTTAVNGEEVTVRVTVTEDGADFIREQAIIDIDRVKDLLASFLVEQTEIPPASIDCPTEIVHAPGSSFVCTAFDGSGGSVDLEVVVRNVEADIDINVV